MLRRRGLANWRFWWVAKCLEFPFLALAPKWLMISVWWLRFIENVVYWLMFLLLNYVKDKNYSVILPKKNYSVMMHVSCFLVPVQWRGRWTSACSLQQSIFCVLRLLFLNEFLLVIMQLPSLSNVQVEPVVVQIDRLDLVLEENPDADVGRTTSR